MTTLIVAFLIPIAFLGIAWAALAYLFEDQ